MKNKLIAFILIIFMAGGVLVSLGTNPAEVSAASTFKVRSSMPKLGDKNAKYYYSDMNRLWAQGRLAPDFIRYKGIMGGGQSGYVWGNCTWWAYGRASEIVGKPINTNIRGNAGEWYNANKRNKCYPYGSTPKVGAIVVYRTHVAVVEKIVNGMPYVSESGWQTKSYGPRSTNDFFFHYGPGWNRYERPQGYIYVTSKGSSDQDIINKEREIKIKKTELNMRTGPGSGYASRGYAKPGSYTVCAQTKDGEWGKLKTNGLWVSLDFTESIAASKSGNNYLRSISVSGCSLSPSFNRSKYEYKATVPSNAKKATIKATGESSKASISGTGKATLKGNSTTKSIKVKAQNKTCRTYKITLKKYKEKKVKVSRSDLNMRTGPGMSYTVKGHVKPGTHSITLSKGNWYKLKSNGYWISKDYAKILSDSKPVVKKSDNNYLKALSVKGYSLSPKFDEKKYSYSMSVASNVSAVTISGTKDHSKAKISGTGKVSLGVGTNTKKIAVKSESGKSRIYSINITRAKEYKVKVNVSELNLRSGPGTKYSSKGMLKRGTYVIVETKDGWGQLKNGKWIKLSYTTKLTQAKKYKVKIDVTGLNMRTGPGTKYTPKGFAKKGTYEITKVSKGWGKLKTNGYWIYLKYTKKV
ncbi:MAG: cadherin-like beta sandwich domain-containing protein [Anaerovoracaceae bacterium]